jgi:hypothetical protein
MHSKETEAFFEKLADIEQQYGCPALIDAVKQSFLAIFGGNVPEIKPAVEHNADDADALFEMACLRKNKTGLPVNIYVDDSGAWKESGHANRIKFQRDRGDRPITRDMIPMSIEDNPQILVPHPDMDLSAADVNAVKRFVVENKELLEKLGDTEIDIEDFIREMVRQ